MIHDMTLTDDQQVARVDDSFMSIHLIDDLASCAESDEDEVHPTGFSGHGSLVDTFGQQEVVVQIDGFAPCLCLVQVGFFDLKLSHHVLMFWVLPAFVLMVFC